MTEAALDTLAERLDAWAGQDGVTLTENLGRLTVRQLRGDQAQELLGLVEAAGLPVLAVGDRGGDLARDELDAGRKGVQVQAGLPASPEGVERILTLWAFDQALGRPDLPARVWVRRLAMPFETLSHAFGPWGDGERKTPVETCGDPRKFTRALVDYPAADADLCRWLLVDPEASAPPESPAWSAWRTRCAIALARTLANEIDGDARLVFRGPPVSRFSLERAEEVDAAGLSALQRAARWTWLNTHEVEQRQALVAAEVARASGRSGDLAALAEVAAPALEGARIAYAFGLQQQSRETLKALSDLRKAVLDETAKLTDINRNLATAVGGAVIAGVGLLVARLTLPTNGVFVGGAALLLGMVVVLHVGATTVSGALFVRLQQRLRREWKGRLYAFLTKDDYEALVEAPVRGAERGFWTTAALGGIMTLLVAAACMIVYRTASVVPHPAPPTLPACPAPVVNVPPANCPAAPSHRPQSPRSEAPKAVPPAFGGRTMRSGG